ncbi:MAG: Histone-lysine N-methyltransferase set9 [Thelocarpon superellum]|nr:MAG: Histone-lysine N-methyltransferase set9 [Thelocarpon superellum]
MPAHTQPPRKEPLTLAQLASYDDIITDALVDRVYFWTTIRKNRSKYFASRGIHDEEVASIIRHAVIVDKDAGQAERRLLDLPGLRQFMGRLKSDKEKEDFRRHVRKYVHIYLPDCPFEVSTTNRYTVVSHEAAVTARRVIRKGETVKYLSGIQVSLTRDEEADLDLRRRDFSIVMSSRKKSASLFLGPARFANHDCDANARLVTTGTNGMEVVAVREIEVGEEITVTYGDDYFGLENCECLCGSCEASGKNGWAAAGDMATNGASTTPRKDGRDDGPYSFRRKRKYAFDRDSLTPTMTTPVLKKRRSSRAMSAIRTALADIPPAGAAVRMDGQAASSHGIDALVPPKVEDAEDEATADSTRLHPPASRAAATAPLHSEPVTITLSRSTDGSMTVADSTPSSFAFEETPRSGALTDASSVSDAPLASTTLVEKMLAQDEQGPRTRANVASKVLEAEAEADVDMDQSTTTVVGRPTSSQKRTPASTHTTHTVLRSTDEPDAPNTAIRTPGDYVLTESLLCESYSAWIFCTICDGAFVQPDAYFTRSSCPRCERHSKLYGYAWPKTDKEGKHDKEERVLDHRTVHRFIRPGEEREIKKGKVRNLLLGRRDTSPIESDADEASPKATTPARGVTTRGVGKRGVVAREGTTTTTTTAQSERSSGRRRPSARLEPHEEEKEAQ